MMATRLSPGAISESSSSHFPPNTQALAGLGWTDGHNVRMDIRGHGDDINRIDTCILRWVTLANINVAKVPILP